MKLTKVPGLIPQGFLFFTIMFNIHGSQAANLSCRQVMLAENHISADLAKQIEAREVIAQVPLKGYLKPLPFEHTTDGTFDVLRYRTNQIAFRVLEDDSQLDGATQKTRVEFADPASGQKITQYVFGRHENLHKAFSIPGDPRVLLVTSESNSRDGGKERYYLFENGRPTFQFAQPWPERTSSDVQVGLTADLKVFILTTEGKLFILAPRTLFDWVTSRLN